MRLQQESNQKKVSDRFSNHRLDAIRLARYWWSRGYGQHYGERSDIEQVAMMVLWKVCGSFDAGHPRANFKALLAKSIERELRKLHTTLPTGVTTLQDAVIVERTSDFAEDLAEVGDCLKKLPRAGQRLLIDHFGLYGRDAKTKSVLAQESGRSCQAVCNHVNRLLGEIRRRLQSAY